jgi:type I restriction enzyme S subunit
MSEFKRYSAYKDSGIEWLGKIPEHWELRRLKYLSDIKTGEKDTIHKEENGKYPFFIRSPKVQKINTYSYDEEAVLTAGDGDIGKIFHYINGKFEVHQRVYKFSNFNKIIGKYLYFYLHYHLAEEVIKLSSKTTVDSLRLPMLQNFPTLLPPISEQIQITNFLDKKTTQIDKAITLKEQLIERLKERRQILINDAVTKGLDKTVKMKNSGIEWIGEIPEHWEVKKVRYLFEFSKGLTITKENLRATGIPCVNYGEIHSKYGFEVDPERHELKCVDEVYLETSQKSLLNHGDFIFADTSEDIEGAGNFTYLNSRIPTFAGYHTIIARSKIGMIPRYIAYYFDSLGFRNQIRSRVKGVKVYSITNSILKDALVCLPEMEEQQRISNYLDKQTKKIDTAIELQQKQIEKLKEYRASLIDSVVTGKVKIMEDEYGSHH